MFFSVGPSAEYLWECLDYDSSTGTLRWKVRPESHFKKPADCKGWNRQFAGKPAFAGIDKDGYRHGYLNDKRYRAHRLVWAMNKGFWPTQEIDHRDTDRANNRIGNLRQATTTKNRQNERFRGNRTGYKGVAPSNPGYANTTYNARIQVGGKMRYLGTFKTPEQAHAAYVKAAHEFFGEFARAV